MVNPIVRAAVVQAAPVMFDTPATIAKLVELAEHAAVQGAEIVVFPEAFVGGYPKGLNFGAHLGMRSPEGREDFRRYYESAITIPGPEFQEISEVARRDRLHLVVGVIEREGGTLYCTALMVGPDGRLLGKHRKLMPTALERLVWGFGDGSTITVVDSAIGRFGSVICWENYMPLLRMAMYAKGIEFYCAPTVDDRETWLPTMRTIALEGRCFVLSSCQYLTRADCPADYAAVQGDDPSTVLIRGGSCIIDPLGNVLVPPCFDGEMTHLADLDRRLIARGKYDLDVAGHYARPDVFSLTVDARPKSPVTFMAPPPLGIDPLGVDPTAGEQTIIGMRRD
ncbi:carbon-nitrogen hydrolase family protein [Nitrospirillum pindoramense]|uniref:Nitrilase n=1 Tax=Nitrospirillum amazonense TaxID=28077 RepID=A0A560H435_9PROT|nr:carbon-nitrogen hydrolase family protein [Nitrospirillum amazonense]TWB41008.1 nitrilase [Nitrospirillum amazonense]